MNSKKIVPAKTVDSHFTLYTLRFTDNKGMALVLTLLVVTLITAMIVEFAYAVYTGTNALNNWQTSQKLSIAARSGTKLASRLITEALSGSPKAYPGYRVFSHAIPSKDYEGTITIRIEDENAKFNINRLGSPFGGLGDKDRAPYASFVRLLESIELKKDVAIRIADWIDTDKEPRLQDSEKDAKNAPLDCIEELLEIPGIGKETYERLLPYVTIYGDRVNINSAGLPVLQSLSGAVSKDLAQRIITYRENTPFELDADIRKVPGFESGAGSGLLGYIDVKGRYFRVVATAESNGIRRVIDSIIETSGGNVVRYWKEL